MTVHLLSLVLASVSPLTPGWDIPCHHAGARRARESWSVNGVHTNGTTLPPWPPGPCLPVPSLPPSPRHLTLLLATGPLHWLFRCWLSLPLREQAILQCHPTGQGSGLPRPTTPTLPPSTKRVRTHFTAALSDWRLSLGWKLPGCSTPQAQNGAPGTHHGAQFISHGIKKSRRNHCHNSPKIPRFSGRSHTPAPVWSGL